MTDPTAELAYLRKELADWRGGARLRNLLANPELDGSGVRIALLDTGVNIDELVSQALRRGQPAPKVTARAIVSSSCNLLPHHSPPSAPHGTTVADVLLRQVPAVELTSIDLFGPRGIAEAETLAAALQWVATQGFRIANVSVGIAETQLQPTLKRQLLWRAIENAYRLNCLLIAAAHNDHPATRGYPAAFGAPLASVRKGEIPPMRLAYEPKEGVEFAAHGRGFFGPFCAEPANSWAAPHTAALAVKLLQLEPDLKPFELKTLLFWLADKPDPPQPTTTP